MKFDPKYISAIVVIIVAVGRLCGIEIGSAGLSEWINSLIVVIGGIVIAVKTFKEGKINLFGVVKK